MKILGIIFLILFGLVILWFVINFLLLLCGELLNRYYTNKILGITKERTLYVLMQERLQRGYKENKITEEQLERGIEITTRLNSKEKIDRKTDEALRTELSNILDVMYGEK